MSDCLHEYMHLDWDFNEDALTVHVYAAICETCGAEAKSLNGEVVLGPWEESPYEVFTASDGMPGIRFKHHGQQDDTT